MSFDYVSKIGNVVNVLSNHNTSTASPDLSASLTTRVLNVFNDDPEIRGIRVDESPSIFVTVNSANEEETQIGDFAGRRKEKTVNYEIIGIYRREGYSKKHEDVLTDFYQMANNVEAVLKRESKLSGTSLHVEGVSTDFKPGIRASEGNNMQYKVFRTNFNVRYFYT